METSATPPISARSSLSRRLLWLTFAVVLLVQILFLVPAAVRARHDWLLERITYGQLAILSLDDTNHGGRSGSPSSDLAARHDGSSTHGELVARRELLQMAGVQAAQLIQSNGQVLDLGDAGLLVQGKMIELHREDRLSALRQTVRVMLDASPRVDVVQARGPVRPGTLVAVAFDSRALSQHLRGFVRDVAGLGLVVAGLTGLLIYLALQALLVRPMRRLTDSIAAFRADPERTPPLETQHLTPSRGDEVARAGHELAEMQRELRAALWRYARLAALGTAAAKVSHDLRSMLAPALLAAERLESHADANVRRIGDTVVRAVERSTELVRGGLEFAREGPITLTRQRFSLHDVAAEAAEQVRASAPTLMIDNRIDTEIEIDADREHMCRVFANLARNAGEAGAAHVVIEATTHPTSIDIFVADDGPGLPPQVLAALFKPFVTGGRRGSTGLGLAIARDLMRAHLGDVELVFTDSGGTRFRLNLPMALSLRQTSRPMAARPTV